MEVQHDARRFGKLTDVSDSLLNLVRRCLKKCGLISLIRTFRRLVHFGPWRVVPQFLIRQLRPVARNMPDEKTSLLDSLDANAIAEEIRYSSVAIAGMLSAEFVSRLRAVTDHLPVNDYQLMHHIDEDVRRLSNDPTIKNVLRAYFGSEPVLLESTLVITKPNEKRRPSEQNKFHFDYAGWESVNVFVYLSDVTAESSCHIVARGSHRNMGFRDVLRASLTNEEALLKYGSSIQSITGPAGTLFFENTEAFHRRNPGDGRRVMLNMLYSSHRGYLSYGRTSQSHIENRARAYNRLRN